MANRTKTTTLVTANVEFEPYCEWQKDDSSDTLIVHLPDFMKDQLRVQVNNLGVVKLSGARPLDGGHTSRFVKETKIPQGCNMTDIRAKFTNGRLHLTMPKKSPTIPASPPQVPKLEAAQKPKEEPSVANDDQKSRFSSGEDGHVFGVGRSLGRVQVGKKVSVSFGVAMLAVVAIGVYGTYKCWTDPSCPSPSSHVEDYYM